MNCYCFHRKKTTPIFIITTIPIYYKYSVQYGSILLWKIVSVNTVLHWTQIIPVQAKTLKCCVVTTITTSHKTQVQPCCCFKTRQMWTQPTNINHWTTDSNNNCMFHVGKFDGSNVLGWKSQILTLNTDVHGFGQKKFEILKQ